MEATQIDLERLGLRSGQARSRQLTVAPRTPSIGSESYPVAGGDVEATIEVSRTTSGFALRLVAKTLLTGPCARCLEPVELPIRLAEREVDQPRSDDPELNSPYVEDGILDAGAWLSDALALAMPDKVLCRSDCAGLCPECGISLNDVDPAEHQHERPLDPRFAKLRELTEASESEPGDD
ncbi:MAG TPA: DUF177 domain-containing protein [Solirubrobacterales bacterium]|nr:DUF177 domain-containing protein [Solirubrobacterales bacterium]